VLLRKGAYPEGREGMNRALVQAGAAVVVFVVLAATSVFLTNTLFKVLATDRPSVTFTVASASPTATP
jgi:hypothetical protein